MASEPPWFLGMMWSTSRARWCSWAPQHSQRPRAAVAAAVGKHLLAALLAEGIEALAAQLLQPSRSASLSSSPPIRV